MQEVSANVSAAVDKMIISHFMRDFTAQVREDVTFLQSLNAEEKAVFERAGQDTRKHAALGAIVAPSLLWAAKRAVVQFAGEALPAMLKSSAVTAKVLSVTAYLAASAIGGFQQAQKAIPANIERLVALPPPSSIGARARASVALVDRQSRAHVPQEKLHEFQLATGRYMRFFPVGQTGEEYALKGAANPFLAAEAFREKVLNRAPASSSAGADHSDDFTHSSSSNSRMKESSPPLDDALAQRPMSSSPSRSSDPSPTPPPASDRPRRRSSYDPPAASRARDAPPDSSGSRSADIKPAGRVVYNKWGDVVTPDDKDA